MTGVLEWIIAQKWAITPGALEAILTIVQRQEITEEAIASAIHGAKWEKYKEANTFQGLEGYDYPLLEGARTVSQVGNVAILPVIGPIVPRASLFSRVSGMSSVDTIAKDFNSAMGSDEIDTIILNIDSPGGEITGMAEVTDMIYEARDKKKILAYVYGMAASAGYWIASSASEIITSPTGESGSIGVVAMFTSTRDQDEKKGIRHIEIISSQSPNKRPDIESNSGMVQIQTIVDTLANVFIERVARNRGIASKDVIEGYGRGGLSVGSGAVEAGLADRLGSLESLIQENRKQINQSSFYSGGYMDLQEFQSKHSALFDQVKKMGKDEGMAEVDAKVAEAKEAGKKEGIATENSRMKAIDELEVPGSEAIISENKFNTSETKESIAAKVLESQKVARAKIQKIVKDDGTTLANDLQGVQSPDNTDVVSAETQALIKAGQSALNQGR